MGRKLGMDFFFWGGGEGGLIFGPGIFFSFVGSTTVFRILIFDPI